MGVIGPVGPSFSPTSIDDRSASQLPGFVQHIDQFLRRIIRNPYRLLFFLCRIQKVGQKTLDVFHEVSGVAFCVASSVANQIIVCWAVSQRSKTGFLNPQANKAEFAFTAFAQVSLSNLPLFPFGRNSLPHPSISHRKEHELAHNTLRLRLSHYWFFRDRVPSGHDHLCCHMLKKLDRWAIT
ncbi:hypothetical protein TNCV_1512451 [Trichonephila clavipes]|nr:hypothetical protein TNCV_1512451 [Trichonephila clavipes]